ncbi:helix-turn-helix domain-containing protein [Streptomyces sp. NPDC059169]|uniref:AraC-like ligand-binding domain-containing protein n=1 Tax=Streptomyces sp. NPDC059169 TaxID=3346754 RepID=UPI0036C75BB2
MDLETVFRSSGVPAAERFGVWHEHLAKLICPMDTSSKHAPDFHGDLQLLQLGPVSLLPTRVQEVSGLRTAKLIRQSDPEFYDVTLIQRGTMKLRHAGREAVHGPQHMYVVDTSRPWETHASPLKSIGLGVPKSLLPLPPEHVGRILARRLSGEEGPGALLAQFLTHLAGNPAPYRPADMPRLGTLAVDLLTTAVAHYLDAESAVPPESRQRVLFLRIQAYIRRHLADPELSPGTIAAAHHISTSYLHRLFVQGEASVAAWIRHQRLEGALRDLVDPRQRTTRIHAIATRWGFPRAADFTRAFRTAYGVPPREYREAACPPGVAAVKPHL